MGNTLLRGRLQIRILPGSPNFACITMAYACCPRTSCSIMRDFTSFFGVRSRLAGTNPVHRRRTWLCPIVLLAKKNLGSAATESEAHCIAGAKFCLDKYSASNARVTTKILSDGFRHGRW